MVPFLFWACSSNSPVGKDTAEKSYRPMDSLCSIYEVPSASLAILQGNELSYWNYGENAHGENTNEHTIYEGASLSKTVLAHAWHDAYSKVTLDTLTCKKLGLKTEAYQEFFDVLYTSDLELALKDIPISHFLNHTSKIDALINDREQDSGFHYSELGYQWLQHVYKETLNSDFFHSFLMQTKRRADFVWQDFMDTNYVDGYVREGEISRPIHRFEIPFSNGTLLTSTSAFMPFLRDCSSLLTARAVNDIVPVQGSDVLYWGNGMGLEIQDSDTILFQWASNHSFNGLFILEVKTGKMGLLLTNSVSSKQMYRPLFREIFQTDLECTHFFW
jgi:hypothetical protein